MKRAAAVLLILIVASLLEQALALDKFDSEKAFGPEVRSFSSDLGLKKLEESIAGALAAISSPACLEGGDQGRSPEAGGAGNDLRLQNRTNNARSLQNGSLNNACLNSSEGNSTLGGKEMGTDDGAGRAGSSSSNQFNGFYSTSASRHEIGKGGVDSSMLLRGEFQMENSLKFQDQGF